MRGMGLSLTPDDFRRIVRAPKAVALGSLGQVVVLPLWGVMATGLETSPSGRCLWRWADRLPDQNGSASQGLPSPQQWLFRTNSSKPQASSACPAVNMVRTSSAVNSLFHTAT